VLAEQLAELDDAGDPDAIAARNPTWHREDATLKARALTQTSPYVVERTLADNRPWWYLDLLSDVRVPTVILGADPAQGAMFDPTVGDEVARRNVRISSRVVPGVGHSIHREAPDVVLDVLRTDDSLHWR
jgi:pimeloyl-ACP methyl ester carboxylesterase